MVLILQRSCWSLLMSLLTKQIRCVSALSYRSAWAAHKPAMEMCTVCNALQRLLFIHYWLDTCLILHWSTAHYE